MKKFISFTSILVSLCFMDVTGQTEAEMKAWQAYMTPGEVHKVLAAADGEWLEDITMWMDPAAAPTKSTATTRNEMVMGGRYQVSKTSGEMMGMPFEGMSVMGYDNAKKLFISTWIDNLGTGIMTLEGPWNEQTKSITLKGKGMDPSTGKEILVRQTIKHIDNDTQEIQMFDTRGGKEVKTMEIKSTRKK